MGIQDKINEIELEMARTQKNKKTEHHLGALKAKIAKYKQQLNAPIQSAKHEGFEVTKSGDARVALIGFPSVGKSTLLSRITSTTSKSAEHEFTTLDCIAGKLNYKGASIQILDLPGIISGAGQNKGRGKQVISIARTADLIVMMLDPRSPDDKSVLERELEAMGIRLNRRKPDMSLVITLSNGINLIVCCDLTSLSEQTIRSILKEYKINNCQLTIREDVSDDDLIDLITGSAVYVKCMYVYNKVDELTVADFHEATTLGTVISCRRDWNLDELVEGIWDSLELIRVYTKRKGEFPALDEPVVLRKMATVKELCKAVHKSFVDNFKHALVWGLSAKHNPQKVGLGHYLSDEDVVQIYLK